MGYCYLMADYYYYYYCYCYCYQHHYWVIWNYFSFIQGYNLQQVMVNAFHNYGCAINKERGFFTVEPCLEYYFAREVTVDVCLHASKANKCASVSGKPFYYVKKCLIYTSRDSHAGCFWMSASAKKVITEDSKVTPQSYEGANCDLPFQLIISHG